VSQVRVLVGTRKGAFVLTADGKREQWDVSGPHFAGWEIYHVKGSAVDPNRVYASQSSGWFGQLIQRSNDGGKTWEAVGNKFTYDGVPGTHQWYDGTPHPWEFKRVWHLEPSLGDPDTVYAGIEDAALFRSTDGGQTWQELSGLRGHGSGPHWQPGAGGMCLHTIILDPSDPAGYSSPSRRRALSAPTMGAPRGGRSTADSIPNTFRIRTLRLVIAFTTWRCIRRVRECSLCRSTGTSCAATTRAIRGKEVSGNLPTDFGFVIDVHAHEPETDLRGPDQERLRTLCSRWEAARVPQPHRRERVGGADERLAAKQLLRQRAARRDGGRLAGQVRRVFRHQRRAGLCVSAMRGIVGRRLCGIFRRVSEVQVGESARR
jgi:hypothetical protein